MALAFLLVLNSVFLLAGLVAVLSAFNPATKRFQRASAVTGVSVAVGVLALLMMPIVVHVDKHSGDDRHRGPHHFDRYRDRPVPLPRPMPYQQQFDRGNDSQGMQGGQGHLRRQPGARGAQEPDRGAGQNSGRMKRQIEPMGPSSGRDQGQSSPAEPALPSR